MMPIILEFEDSQHILQTHLAKREHDAKMLAQYIYQYSGDNRLLVKNLGEIVNLNSLQPSEFEMLVKYVNQRYNKFIDNLTAKHPKLSKSDLLVCCTMITGYSAVEMSVSFGYKTPDSVYNRKYALKQTLNLPKEANLDEYLWSLAGIEEPFENKGVNHKNNK